MLASAYRQKHRANYMYITTYMYMYYEHGVPDALFFLAADHIL